MKKWIFTLLLVLAAVLSAVSCTKDPKEIDRDSVETTAGSGGLGVEKDNDTRFGKVHQVSPKR